MTLKKIQCQVWLLLLAKKQKRTLIFDDRCVATHSLEQDEC